MELFKPERVVAYVDGFNLYYGLRDSGFQRYYSLDLRLLVLNLIRPGQQLVGVKYFTSLVTRTAEEKADQENYLRRISSIPGLTIVFGKFKKEKTQCQKCDQYYPRSLEKMTDVNIATHMVSDFYTDRFDTAMLISGDTDLIPPIRLVNEGRTNKRVLVCFPPGRTNDEVKKHARGSMVIGRKILSDSQL